METTINFSAVEQWILSQQDSGPRLRELDPDLDLFDAGVLTSLQVIELQVVIERAGGAKVDRMSIQPEDFRTVRGMKQRFFPGLAG